MHPANYDLETYKGEDFKFSLVFKNPDGTPVDLSGCQVLAGFRHEQEKETLIDLNPSIDVGTATISMFVSSSVTNTLRLGTGAYDLILIDVTGHREVLLKGAFHVKYSPTVSAPD